MFSHLCSDLYKPEVLFGKEPAHIPLQGNDGSNGVDHSSLQTLLETRCKSIFLPFNPAWWLFNGHLQTMYCVTGNFSKQDRMSYHRTYLRVDDGGTLGLDFAPFDQSSLPKCTPIVVVQHGLTGGSYEPYVRAILSRACAPLEDGGLGYRGVVINFRGCAGVPMTSPMFYSAAHTNDTRQALRYIAYLYPDALLLGVGFSLGANVLVRYLGEERELSRVHAACALGCPWNLLQNNEGLENTTLGYHIYSKAMGKNLVRLVRRHARSLTANPDHHVTKACEEALKLDNPTLAKFDNAFTRVAGGPSPFPFPTADDYYVHASSHKFLSQVTVPLLTVNAKDDPIVKYVPTENRENGHVVMVLTGSGGHLGWFQSSSGGGIDRWTTKPVLEWLKVMGEEVLHEPKQRGSSIYVDEEGFLREKGQEHLGCKKIEGGGLVDGNGGEEGILQGL